VNHEINVKGAAKGAFIGGAAAGLLNVGVYFVAAAMGADFKPKDPAAMGGMAVLPPFQPMVNCLIAAAISVGVVALLGKVAKSKAWTIYLVISALVFLAEGYAPFWAFADLKTIVALELMHVPAALFIIGGIARMGLGKGPAPTAA
jgi:hypothetical protein